MSYADPSAITQAVAEILRPPRRMLVSDAAKKYVRVVAGNGSSTPWDASVTPYMVEPMDCSTRRDLEAVIFVGPARTGKTEALGDCRLAYAVKCDPGDFMMLFPTEILAGDFSKRRLRRLHKHSGDIGAMLSPSRHDDAVGMKFYRNGMILNLAWPTSSQVAQRDIRTVLLSDYDSMPDDIDGEGSGFDLAKKRTQAYMSAGMTIAESSPKRTITDPNYSTEGHEAPPVDGGILPLFNRGDRRLWHWFCIGCGDPFEAPALPQFDKLNGMQASADSAFVPCPSCGYVHRPSDKRALNINGRWLAEGALSGEPRKSSIASFWLKGCAAAFQSWSSLVMEHLRGVEEYERTGSETKLKTTANIDQGLPYLPKSLNKQNTSDSLMDRQTEIKRGMVPAGVRYLLALVDVQGGNDRRFVVQVLGFGVGQESWLIDRYSIRYRDDERTERIDMSANVEDWDVLTDKVVKASYPLADGSGRRMAIHRTGCDSGGEDGVTDRIYAYYRKLKRDGLSQRFVPIKGASTMSAPVSRVIYPDNSSGKSKRSADSRGDIPVLAVNTNLCKDAVFNNMARQEPGPGHMHWPKWVGRFFFEEMSTEIRQPSGKWENFKRRNEAFVLYAYAHAMNHHIKADVIRWDAPPVWAQEWDNNSLVFIPGEEKDDGPSNQVRGSRRVRFRMK